MENTRLEKEEILKAKLGSEEVDLKSIPDENLDNLVSEEEVNNDIKVKTGVENLNVEELSPEEKEQLLGSLKTGEADASLIKTESKEKIINTLSAFGLKENEAEEIYEDFLIENTSAIDHIYEILHCEGAAIPEDDPRDAGIEYKEPDEAKVPDESPIESLENQKGEKLGDAPDIPKMEYEYKEEAKEI